MSKRWIDWQSILDISANMSPLITTLTPQSVVFINALSGWYNSRYNWQYGDNPITDEQWDAIQNMISDTEDALMTQLIGMVLPNVLATLGNLPLLNCDGASYSRADYPLLYDAIDSVYIIDADNFRVPDLRDVFMRGSSLSNPIGSTGGEDSVTLTEAQMPAHTHTNSPHSHSEIASTVTPTSISAGVPQPVGLPTPSFTGLSSVVIDSAGGSQPHNNIPKYESINFVIIAG